MDEILNKYFEDKNKSDDTVWGMIKHAMRI
jgi:hypothetical protein